MKSALQIAPNNKKPEELSSKNKNLGSNTDVTSKKKLNSQKDVKRGSVRTADDTRQKSVNIREKENLTTPTKQARRKDPQKKTVNVIIKKSFTYIDSGSSIGFFDGRNSRNGLPPRSPTLEGKKISVRVQKATRPVTPVKNITMPKKTTSSKSMTSEQIKNISKKLEIMKKDLGNKPPKSSGSLRRTKKKKEWDDNFAVPTKESKDEEKKKKVNFQVDAYKELMSVALASGSRKRVIDQGKSKCNEGKRFKAKQGQQKAKGSLKRVASGERKQVEGDGKEKEEKPKKVAVAPKEFDQESEKSEEEVRKSERELKKFEKRLEKLQEPGEIVKKFEEKLQKVEEVLVKSQEVLVKPQEVLVKPQEMLVKPQEMLVKPQEMLKKSEETLRNPPEEEKKPEEVLENVEEELKTQEEFLKPDEEDEDSSIEEISLEEMNQQVEDFDKSSIIDKIKHEVQMNILNKLYICSKRSDSKEKLPEITEPKTENLMNNTNQIKHRWNLKSYPLKRKRIKGTVDDRCNASLTDGKLYDDAAIKLKRHNTEPHSYRGFIWRHSSEIPNNCNDYSVTSLASSLKHLNTDDLEDFVFWETVPPKSTSCWEVSLYQSKKPWSVLSCSVFQSNRLSDTPGIILENLRSGRSFDSRISYNTNAPVKSLPKSISFDVEPSIAQKNIDIRNWVAALNFETPEPPPVLSERTLSDQPPHQILSENLSKGVHNAPSDCTIKEKKLKIQHVNTGKKTPGKRARSAFDEHTKMQLSIPPAENMSLINGVFLAKGIKVLDYDKKNDIIKTLITKGSPVKVQTRCVYMMHHLGQKSASERVRKSRDGRKSQGEPSQDKSRDTARSHSRKRDSDHELDGLMRKGSGGFVTVEQYYNKDGKIEKRPETREKVAFSGVEKISNYTDFNDEGYSHDYDEPRPFSGGKKHKHEGENTNVCCLGEYRQLNPEESRKARMDYGKFALNKEIERKRQRAKSRTRTRSRGRQTTSLLRLVTRRYSSDDNVAGRTFPKIFIFLFILLLIGGAVAGAWKMGWISLIYLIQFKEYLEDFYLKF